MLKLFEPEKKGCRIVIPAGKWYTDLVETKPIEIWEREYKTVVIAKPDMHVLLYLWNFDPPSEALGLLSKVDRTEEEEKRLDQLLSVTISPAD
ncbi:MAG: hypothetical protein RBT74_06755 [Tenuifilaceae bacterium]|nr:hypothetical protein [Tenuifilaceae bacterium]